MIGWKYFLKNPMRDISEESFIAWNQGVNFTETFKNASYIIYGNKSNLSPSVLITYNCDGF